jgi:hypothetical protein
MLEKAKEIIRMKYVAEDGKVFESMDECYEL